MVVVVVVGGGGGGRRAVPVGSTRGVLEVTLWFLARRCFPSCPAKDIEADVREVSLELSELTEVGIVSSVIVVDRFVESSSVESSLRVYASSPSSARGASLSLVFPGRGDPLILRDVEVP